MIPGRLYQTNASFIFYDKDYKRILLEENVTLLFLSEVAECSVGEIQYKFLFKEEILYIELYSKYIYSYFSLI